MFCSRFSIMFSSRFILLNNSALTNLPSSPHAVFLRGLRPQDAGTPLLVLLQKKSILLCTVQLQCLWHLPGRGVTEKSHFFHTYRRSVRDQGQIRDACGTQPSYGLRHLTTTQMNDHCYKRHLQNDDAVKNRAEAQAWSPLNVLCP
jgi:hypothetical protein